MTVAEFSGYVAAGLVFATFYMKTMIALRLVGITSNIAFLIYASFARLTPVLVLHGALLPLNICRLLQIQALVREGRKAALGALQVEILLSFMTPRRAGAGETLFRRGEVAA